MASLGLGRAAAAAIGHDPLGRAPRRPGAFDGAAEEVSSGKDTPSGHWEIAAVPVPFGTGESGRLGGRNAGVQVQAAQGR